MWARNGCESLQASAGSKLEWFHGWVGNSQSISQRHNPRSKLQRETTLVWPNWMPQGHRASSKRREQPKEIRSGWTKWDWDDQGVLAIYHAFQWVESPGLVDSRCLPSKPKNLLQKSICWFSLQGGETDTFPKTKANTSKAWTKAKWNKGISNRASFFWGCLLNGIVDVNFGNLGQGNQRNQLAIITGPACHDWAHFSRDDIDAPNPSDFDCFFQILFDIEAHWEVTEKVRKYSFADENSTQIHDDIHQLHHPQCLFVQSLHPLNRHEFDNVDRPN